MRVSVATRYALRSLGRNLRRTLLSCIGVGFGVAIGLITIGWIGGEADFFVKAAAEGGSGHLRIVPTAWPKRHDPTLRLTGYPAVLRIARSLPGVRVATPRARAQGLLAMGNHVASVELTGVDPRTEPKTLRLVRQMSKGRYLRPGDTNATIMGKALADRLHAELGDELGRHGRAQGRWHGERHARDRRHRRHGQPRHRPRPLSGHAARARAALGPTWRRRGHHDAQRSPPHRGDQARPRPAHAERRHGADLVRGDARAPGGRRHRRGLGQDHGGHRALRGVPGRGERTAHGRARAPQGVRGALGHRHARLHHGPVGARRGARARHRQHARRPRRWRTGRVVPDRVRCRHAQLPRGQPRDQRHPRRPRLPRDARPVDPAPTR